VRWESRPAGLFSKQTSWRLRVSSAHGRILSWELHARIRKGFDVSGAQAELKGQEGLRFHPHAFLAKAGAGRTIIQCGKRQVVFAQGAPADSVFYLQQGKVKLAVISRQGKEAIIAIFEPGEFFGEDCLAGQTLRMGTATAMTDTSLLRIAKDVMHRLLNDEPRFAKLFMSYVLRRNIRVQEDLVDHLFNAAEKRLARALLLLAHYGEEEKRDIAIPRISQEMLAEMIGTTRSRINAFMNKFRTLGLIEYNGSEMRIHNSLLNVVIRD